MLIRSELPGQACASSSQENCYSIHFGCFRASRECMRCEATCTDLAAGGHCPASEVLSAIRDAIGFLGYESEQWTSLSPVYVRTASYTKPRSEYSAIPDPVDYWGGYTSLRQRDWASATRLLYASRTGWSMALKLAKNWSRG